MKIAQELRHAVASVSTKSVLNPFLWLCGIISLPCIFVSTMLTGPLQWAILMIALVPIALVVTIVVRNLDRPELFQSEEYRLRDHALKIYGDSDAKSSGELAALINVTPQLTLSDMNNLGRENNNG